MTSMAPRMPAREREARARDIELIASKWARRSPTRQSDDANYLRPLAAAIRDGRPLPTIYAERIA